MTFSFQDNLVDGCTLRWNCGVMVCLFLSECLVTPPPLAGGTPMCRTIDHKRLPEESECTRTDPPPAWSRTGNPHTRVCKSDRQISFQTDSSWKRGKLPDDIPRAAVKLKSSVVPRPDKRCAPFWLRIQYSWSTRPGTVCAPRTHRVGRYWNSVQGTHVQQHLVSSTYICASFLEHMRLQ